jgi:hypothetical protein
MTLGEIHSAYCKSVLDFKKTYFLYQKVLEGDFEFIGNSLAKLSIPSVPENPVTTPNQIIPPDPKTLEKKYPSPNKKNEQPKKVADPTTKPNVVAPAKPNTNKTIKSSTASAAQNNAKVSPVQVKPLPSQKSDIQQSIVMEAICEICIEIARGDELFSLKCHHYFHKKCLSDFVLARLMKNEVPTCPGGGNCTEKIPEELISEQAQRQFELNEEQLKQSMYV